MQSTAKHRAAVLLMALLLWSELAYAQDRFAFLSACSANASHVEQRECLEAKMKRSLAELGEAQRGLMERLRAIDENAEDKNRAIAAAQADAAAFVSYASKHCESFAALAFGSNSQQDRRLACHIELNNLRAQQVTKVALSVP